MILYPMEEMLAHVSSRYELVNMVAHRARQLATEAERNETPLKEKAVTIALNEVRAGELRPDDAEQA